MFLKLVKLTSPFSFLILLFLLLWVNYIFKPELRKISTNYFTIKKCKWPFWHFMHTHTRHTQAHTHTQESEGYIWTGVCPLGRCVAAGHDWPEPAEKKKVNLLYELKKSEESSVITLQKYFSYSVFLSCFQSKFIQILKSRYMY